MDQVGSSKILNQILTIDFFKFSLLPFSNLVSHRRKETRPWGDQKSNDQIFKISVDNPLVPSKLSTSGSSCI